MLLCVRVGVRVCAPSRLRARGCGRGGRARAGVRTLPAPAALCAGGPALEDLSGHMLARSTLLPAAAARPRSFGPCVWFVGPLACPWGRGVGARPRIGFLIRT